MIKMINLTKCESCAHSTICKYTNDYVKSFNALNDVDIKCYIDVKVCCTHFLKEKNDILNKPTGSINKNKSSIA